MHKFRNIIFVLAGFLMVGMLAGCQKSENAGVVTENVRKNEVKKSEKEMVVAENISDSGESLAMGNVLLNRSNFWGGLVFRGLLIADEEINNVRKDLCTEYTISPNGMTYIFVLQDDLYWHDGEKLTVEDVVWSIETCLRFKEVNSYIQKGLRGIVGADMFMSGKMDYISGISVEENSITIKMSKPDNNFLASLAQLPILPKHCLEDVPVEELGSCEFWEMPVGSGPYKVVENRDNKEVILELNEDYSGKMPKIERIRYKFLENTETDEFTFAITSDPEVIEKFSQYPEYKVIKTGNLYYCYLYFNLDGRSEEESKRLHNKNVRQALFIGIDRENIIKEIYKGAATVIDGGIPSSDTWYQEKDADKVEYNPELAKRMLKESEFDFTKPMILTRYSQDDMSVQLLEKIAENWRQLGIKVEIEPIDAGDTDKLWVKPDWYDVGLKNLSAVDYSDWYYEYASENQLWSQIYHNRTIFDVLIAALKGTKWAYERSMLYNEIQSMEAEEMYKVPLAIVPQYVIYNKEELILPEMEFPNMEYYFDLNISQWIMKE